MWVALLAGTVYTVQSIYIFITLGVVSVNFYTTSFTFFYSTSFFKKYQSHCHCSHTVT